MKYKGSVFGKIKGNIGNIQFAKWKELKIMRSKSWRKTKVLSPKQKIVLDNMLIINKLYHLYKPLLMFHRTFQRPKRFDLARFQKINYSALFSKTAKIEAPKYENIILNDFSVNYNSYIALATKESNYYLINWVWPDIFSYLKLSDYPYSAISAYCPRTDNFLYDYELFPAVVGSGYLKLPITAQKGDVYYCTLYFFTIDAKNGTKTSTRKIILP